MGGAEQKDQNLTFGPTNSTAVSLKLICIGIVIVQTVKRLSVYNAGDRFEPWVGKIPWGRKWPSTPVLLPGKSHGQRSLVGYSLRGLKESDTTELAHIIHDIRIRNRYVVLSLWSFGIVHIHPMLSNPILISTMV